GCRFPRSPPGGGRGVGGGGACSSPEAGARGADPARLSRRASYTVGMSPLVLLNTVGLTGRLLAHAPRLRGLAEAGWQRPLREVLPAVTCTAQATFLTGRDAAGHRIVRNRWALPRP